MAEKEAKKPDAAAGSAKGEEKKGEAKEASAKKGGLLSKTPVLLGGVMFLEALVLFAGFKFIMGSQPKVVAAEVTQATDGAGDGQDTGRTVRPHLRRAHWHTYWTGARSEPSPEVRWIHPVTVHGDKASAERATVIDVDPAPDGSR